MNLIPVDHDPCPECDYRFTEDEWDNRHSRDEDGADVHAECCGDCQLEVF